MTKDEELTVLKEENRRLRTEKLWMELIGAARDVKEALPPSKDAHDALIKMLDCTEGLVALLEEDN